MLRGWLLTRRVVDPATGRVTLVDRTGNRYVPELSMKTSGPGEFATFDGSRGHCGLCGSLPCVGSCFK